MTDLYKFLMEKFGVKKGEKFTLIHYDIKDTRYYQDCYFDDKGIVNGERKEHKEYFSGNFIFKVLNSLYSIVKYEDLKSSEHLWYIDPNGERRVWNKTTVHKDVAYTDDIDFRLANLYQNGLLFASESEATLPCNLAKAKEFYENLYKKFWKGAGLK